MSEISEKICNFWIVYKTMVVYSKYEAHYILHLVQIVTFYDKMNEDSGRHSTMEAVIHKFATMTIRLNRQINYQQCSHQTKRPPIFELGILPYPHYITLLL